jgi:hypothetical protein
VRTLRADEKQRQAEQHHARTEHVERMPSAKPELQADPAANRGRRNQLPFAHRLILLVRAHAAGSDDPAPTMLS